MSSRKIFTPEESRLVRQRLQGLYPRRSSPQGVTSTAFPGVVPGVALGAGPGAAPTPFSSVASSAPPSHYPFPFHNGFTDDFPDNFRNDAPTASPMTSSSDLFPPHLAVQQLPSNETHPQDHGQPRANPSDTQFLIRELQTRCDILEKENRDFKAWQVRAEALYKEFHGIVIRICENCENVN